MGIFGQYLSLGLAMELDFIKRDMDISFRLFG
jgi:hypothetical protein